MAGRNFGKILFLFRERESNGCSSKQGNKAGYKAIQVKCGSAGAINDKVGLPYIWARAAVQKKKKKKKTLKNCKSVTNQLTNWVTDLWVFPFWDSTLEIFLIYSCFFSSYLNPFAYGKKKDSKIYCSKSIGPESVNDFPVSILNLAPGELSHGPTFPKCPKQKWEKN